MTRSQAPFVLLLGVSLSVVVGCSGNNFDGKSASKRSAKEAASVSPGEGEGQTPAPGSRGTGDGTPGSVSPEGPSPDAPVDTTVIDVEPVVIPALKAAFVEVPGDTLGPEANVSFIWKTEASKGDLEGWKAKVEVKTLGSNEWTEVGLADASEGKLTTRWGDRANGAFESRVTFVRESLDSNTASANWAPHLFSTAILTRTVQCLFCHVRIEGDVGGINFPTNMHEATATGVRILGELFATNEIPGVFQTGPSAKGAVSTGQMFENYDNTGKKIFPKPVEGGVVDFPSLPEETLASRMLGRLKGHASKDGASETDVTKVHKGDLFLDGGETAIELSGEVFVDGDLVIKGTYTGQGTIYARNIFIIGDVRAKSSPFPFSSNESEALEQARASIVRGDDALYLAALNQIWVAEYDTDLGNASQVVPVSRSGAFNAVGGEQKLLEIAQRPLGPADYINGTPNEEKWSFRVDPKIRIDVQRVDAFLFANDAIVWRSHGNWLLNGGFISPKAAMTSRMQRETGSFWCNGSLDAPDAKPDACGKKKAELINPRNGLPSHTNVIRFDYRLRAGGVGFESIRDFF